MAIREDLYKRAGGVVAIDFQSSCTSLPHGKRMRLMTQRIAEGRMLQWIQQTRQVGRWDKGQVVPTKLGVPPGAPIAPWYSNSDLHRLDPRWHSRGDPAQLGATRHRFADDARLVCRQSARPALAAVEAMAKRLDLTRNRDKTRATRVTEGFDGRGFECVKRPSPTRGKHTIDRFAAQSAQQQIRHTLNDLPSRRAPSSPQDFVAQVNPVMTGWGTYFRPTNASPAFRGLPRFVNLRVRRSLTQRSNGRGLGWQRYPNRTRSAMGLADIGSGKLAYGAKPGPGVR
jgi:RNA-directed DNA polymerase